MRLANSIVKRGGVTSPYWYGETRELESLSLSDGIHVKFQLPSKGGGDTQVEVVIGVEDIGDILKELAISAPGLALALAEATVVAVRLSGGPNAA
jgi:hypothetical protein